MDLFSPLQISSVAMETIDGIISSGQRKLLVASAEVFLDTISPNTIFVLMVQESRGSAGGRAAGSGSRRIDRILGFGLADGKYEQFFDSSDPQIIERFDIPYSAVAMDIRLSDGSAFVVQGVIDAELVGSYVKIATEGKTE